MWVNRKLLGEMLGRWHTEAQAHIDLSVVNAERDRGEASDREQRLMADLDRARKERLDLLAAFRASEDMTGRMLDETRRKLAVAEGQIFELKRQVAVTQNNFEWARVRLNSVEQERAVLIDRVLGVTFPVPVMTHVVGPADTRQVAPAPDEDASSNLLRGLGLPLDIFEDVGDDAAQAAGLEHEDDGTVKVK